MVRGQPEPAPGPLVARFRSYGGLCQGQLVAGPWGELSPHLHQLLKIFAESRVAAMGRAQGWEAGPNMLGKVMGEVRRSMSVTVVRAQALCLLERPWARGPGRRPEEAGHFGPGGEEEEGEAGLRPGQPGERPEPRGPGLHPVNFNSTESS